MTILSNARAVSLAAVVAFSGVGVARGQFYLTGYAAGAGASNATGLSADGQVAAGTSFATSGDLYINPGFEWSLGGGRSDFGLQAGLPTTTNVLGISGNGQVVTGQAGSRSGTRRAFRYSGPGSYQSLGTIGNFAVSEGHGLNNDGSVIVGIARDANFLTGSAFRWTQAGGMQSLGFTRPSHFYSNATAISRDGSSVVGYSYDGDTTDAFVWNEESGMSALHGLNGSRAHAYGVNGDGTIVVGTADFTDTGARAVLWQNGQLLDLGINQSVGSFTGTDVSDDGKVVIGQVGEEFAGIWTPSTGILLLGDYLAAHGVSGPTGWQFLNATAISADGRTIAGWGYSSATGTQGFVVNVPSPASVFCLLGIAACKRRTRKL